MARIPLTGSSVTSIYERTPEVEWLIEHGRKLREAGHPDVCKVGPNEYLTTLAEVVAVLDIKLSDEEKRQIRPRLESVVGLGLQQFAHSPTWNPDARLLVRHVIATLNRTAKRLDRLDAGKLDTTERSKLEEVLHGTQTGWRTSHHTAAASRLMRALASEVGEDRAQAMVLDYRGHSREIAIACRNAVVALGRTKGEDGRPEADWFPQFFDVLLFVAERNGITPTIDQRAGEPQGGFLQLATEFQKLLHFSMRALSEGALAKRLNRERASRLNQSEHAPR
jgi:hypothetical protein